MLSLVQARPWRHDHLGDKHFTALSVRDANDLRQICLIQISPWPPMLDIIDLWIKYQPPLRAIVQA